MGERFEHDLPDRSSTGAGEHRRSAAARDALAARRSRPGEFQAPQITHGIRWQLFINTAAESPGDIYPNLDGPTLRTGSKLTLIDHSLMCYVSTG